MIASFDRLNELNIKRRSIPFKQYFGEMDLFESQKKERIEAAKKIYDLMMLFFEFVAVGVAAGAVDWDYMQQWLASQLQIIVAGIYVDGDDLFMGFYPVNTAQQIIEATRQVYGVDGEKKPSEVEEAKIISEDRAMFIAENESNALYNRADYEIAVKRGKKFKTWIAKTDSKVRKTHREVDRKKIPIEEFFQVGMAEMLYPKDVLNAAGFPEEIVNCRCVVKYS